MLQAMTTTTAAGSVAVTSGTITSFPSADHCGVCGREFRDPVSKEAGIGPICRKKANELLAREVPNNQFDATLLLMQLSGADIPAPARATFDRVVEALHDRRADDRQDWRRVVAQIIFVLGHRIVAKTRDTLIAIVRALGYVGLAALLAGEAADGGTASFADGELRMRAAVPHPVKKALPRYKAQGYGDGFGVGAAFALKLEPLLRAHFPFAEGLDEALAAAREYALRYNLPIPSTAEAVIELGDKLLVVRTPYDGRFVAGLKDKVPPGDRRWNGKAWEVAADHYAVVVRLIGEHFPELEAETVLS